MQKTKKKSLFRRITEFLHLWLGLISGIVLFVVCLTAAIWVFRDEVSYLAMPEARIKKQLQPYLLPSALVSAGKLYLQRQGKDTAHIKLFQLSYHQPGQAASLEYEVSPDVYGYMLFNPYTGTVTYMVEGETRTDKFFTFIRAGHRFFWLPRRIGSPFVGTCCLLFLVILITGLIWWYPKKWNDSTRKKSFKISWKSNWKRVNIDLHNVLGFYASLIVLMLAFTGTTFTFSWLDKGYHKLITGKPYEEEVYRVDSKAITPVTPEHPADKLWGHYAEFIKKGNYTLSISYPQDSADSWQVTVFPTLGRIANSTRYYHDQYSLQLLKQSADYHQLPVGEKLYSLTFDIHVATIWGLPSKILASMASLIGASLPVTGFIIWYNRKFGKKKKKAA